MKILIPGLCVIDGLAVDVQTGGGGGGGVSGAVRVVAGCSGTRGLSLVEGTDGSAITYELKICFK